MHVCKKSFTQALRELLAEYGYNADLNLPAAILADYIERSIADLKNALWQKEKGWAQEEQKK